MEKLREIALLLKSKGKLHIEFGDNLAEKALIYLYEQVQSDTNKEECL